MRSAYTGAEGMKPRQAGKGFGEKPREKPRVAPPKQSQEEGVDNFGNIVLKGEKKSKAFISKAKEDKLAAAAASANNPEAKARAQEARKKFTRIDAFEGTFDFLAMDFLCDVAWDGRVFRSATHALLAAQYPAAILDIQEAADAEAARKAAEGETEVEDWASFRLKAVERLMRDKFRRSEDFRKRVKDTGTRDLVWENAEDAFWGSIKGRGQNQLGRVLMDIRSSILNDTEWETWLFLCCEMESDQMRRPPVELLEQKGVGDGGGAEQKKMHRLSGSGYFKFGKLPTNAVQALHPSVSREHAILIHTRSWVAKKTGGLALIDLGSKSGTSISGRKIPHAWTMEPVKNGDSIKLGVSTRDYLFSVNLKHQIELLEQQERELMKEVKTIDADAENPIEAAKRAAREEATVFVGNLDFETEKADLLGLFQDCGHVDDVRFPGADTSKAARGIAFVIFDSAMAARRAVGLNGEQFKTRRVRVAPANENRSALNADGDGGGKGKGKEKGKGKGKGKDDDGNRREERRPSPSGGGSRQLAQQVRRERSRPRSGSRSLGRNRDARQGSRSRERQRDARQRSCSRERQPQRRSPSQARDMRTVERENRRQRARSVSKSFASSSFSGPKGKRRRK